MTPIQATIHDSMTLLRRDLRHIRQYPVTLLVTAGVPAVFLLLFVHVLGDTLGAGLSGPAGGRAEYLAYVTPALIVLGVASAAQGTAISVSTDMTSGIIARFRTMPISRAAVLTGHVLGNVLQTIAGVAIVFALAVLVGFRATTGPLAWLGAFGLLVLMCTALTWFAVWCGLVAKTVESASNIPMPLSLLPFLGSGFVPTESMPTGLRWFAEYQPFTPIIETFRGLLIGGPLGSTAALAVGWCVVITIACAVPATRRYHRERRVG